MTEKIDTIIIGGGQAGLSTSYYLSQQGRDHIILEKADHAVQAWRNRWDSFTLITPNWMIQLPGAEYQGDCPDDFMVRSDVVAYFERYAAEYEMPIEYNSQVSAVESNGSGFRVFTSAKEFKATNVVIATGMYQRPKIPNISSKISPEILQIHASEYRNPELLPSGGVLVVGSAQSGSQIAEELYQCGRQVFLCVSRSGRFPRRYRGKDITRWNAEMGTDDTRVDSLPSPKSKFEASSHGTGKNGGHSINLHQFARDGVTLLGRIQSAGSDRILLASDLNENLAFADKSEADLVLAIDNFIEKSGLEAPKETLPNLRDGYQAELIQEINLKAAQITTIIWATGYRYDFDLVKLPVFDEDGFPVQKRGVCEYPGLYFIGLPFLYTIKSGNLAGIGRDAAYLTEQIGGRTQSNSSLANHF